MKVAVCIKGQPRNYKVGFDSINREIISKYDTDVFGHAWWDPQEVGKSYFHAPWALPSTIQPDLDKILPELYHFKKFTIEPTIIFPQNRIYEVSEGTKPNREKFIQILLSSYYSLKCVLTLMEEYEKENNIDYDWLFLTRYDIGIFSLPKLDTLDRDKIYTSNMHRGRKYIFSDCAIIFGKHKFVLKNMFEDFDKNYDRVMNLSIHDMEETGYDNELINTKALVGEPNIAFNFLFNGVLNNVIKHPEMMCNLIRDGHDPSINTYQI